MTRIITRELAPAVGDLTANHELIIEVIEVETAAGADVLVLPELATSGYMFADVAEVASCAIGADDPRIAEWSSAINGRALVVIGFAERDVTGTLYNSAAVIDATGTLAVYRKAHLWDREKLYFLPGSQPPPISDTPHGRIAVMICYDLEFPEYTRRAALSGADLIAAPVNWPLVPRPAAERPPEVLLAQATARVNHVFIACCDRTGTERGQQWTQGSCLIDPDGWLLSRIGGNPQADVDLRTARNKRLTEHADLFADRRPDLY